jgi:hypothetical protein
MRRTIGISPSIVCGRRKTIWQRRSFVSRISLYEGVHYKEMQKAVEVDKATRWIALSYQSSLLAFSNSVY